MEVARKLDLADRYLNTVSTKYQLRAGLKEQAEATVSLFTKWDASGQNNLFEMQASWYELALAATYRRAGDLPNAITQYTNVIKVRALLSLSLSLPCSLRCLQYQWR
jgi:peptide alpha-N-acetyltransferase